MADLRRHADHPHRHRRGRQRDSPGLDLQCVSMGGIEPGPWITVQESSIVGTGVLTFNVAANPGPARTATFTVAGHTVTVTQAPQ